MERQRKVIKLNYKAINQKDLYKFLKDNFESSKESSAQYPKFKIPNFDDIVLFETDNGNWLWFFQGDSSKKYSVVDGIILHNLWNEAQLNNVESVEGSAEVEEKNKEIKHTSFDDLNLKQINIYRYREFVIRELKTMYLKDNKALAIPLYLLDGNILKTVGLWAKMPRGKNPFIYGSRGVALHKTDKKIATIVVGESILDCLAFQRMENLKDVLYISTQGSLSKNAKDTIDGFVFQFKITSIFSVFDNDKAGEKFREQVQDLFPKVVHKIPKHKDFLDDFIKS